MDEEKFKEHFEQIVGLLNEFYNDSEKTGGFILLCGIERPTGKNTSELDFRTMGAGSVTMLAPMMYEASTKDENYSLIFEIVVKMHKEAHVKKQKDEVISLKLRPTINKFFK